MNKISIVSRQGKLSVTLNGEPVKDAVGFSASGTGKETVVSLSIKAELSIVAEDVAPVEFLKAPVEISAPAVELREQV